MNKKELTKLCVAAATDFFQARPWLSLQNADLLLFDLPDEPDPVVVSVMGAAGEEFGIFALRGRGAMAEMLRIAGSRQTGRRIAVPLLSVSLEQRQGFDAPWERFLETAGHRGRTAPLFLAKVPGEQSRMPRRDELEILLYVLQVVVKIKRQGQLGKLADVAIENPSLYPRLAVQGAPHRPRFDLGVVDVFALMRSEPAAAGPSIEPPEALSHTERCDAHYLVGLHPMLATVAGDTREMYALAVVDAGNGLCHVELVPGLDLHKAADHLFSVFAGQTDALPTGWPARMTFDHRGLLDALRESLEARGVDCAFAPEIPDVDALLAAIDSASDPASDSASATTAGASAADDAAIAVDGDSASIPAGDDLDAWKRLDFEVSNRVAGAISKKALNAARPWRKFFGVPRAETMLEPEEYRVMKLISYLEWYAYAHRTRSSSRTEAERMLAGPLPAGQRKLLEMRQAAVPSLYRFENIVTGESLELVDLVSGARITIQDRALSASAREGSVGVLRVYPAGTFWFAAVAGPVMPDYIADGALEYLEADVGLSLDGEAGRRRAGHLLGRLWAWAEDRISAGLPRMTNTQGHELAWHAASFSVRDPDAVARALDEGEEFDSHGAAGGEWAWCDDEGFGGGRRHLGSLTLLGEELLLEVNSAERFETGRILLEALPGGVRFHRVTEQSLDPGEPDSRPLDDRLPDLAEPVELDAEAMLVVQDMVRKQCFRWLDQQIPALGGQTPRETCATESGRRRVERLIRTYPDPGGMPGVTVPREEMLRELGLG